MKACCRANSQSESLASFFTADDLNIESSRGHFVSGRSGGGNMFLNLSRSSLASGLEKEDATVAMLFSDSLGTSSPLEISDLFIPGARIMDARGWRASVSLGEILGSVAET